MDTKQLDLIDTKTGEVIDGFVTVMMPKKRNAFRRHFTMNQDAMNDWKMIKSPDDHRVLVALLQVLDYDNLIIINQSQIGRDLEIDQARVSRSISRLIGYGALIKGPRDGNRTSYRLNHNWGWKGSAEGHLKVVQGGQGQNAFTFDD